MVGELVIKKQLITVAPDGKLDIKEIENPPTLKELQAIVDGYIELVPGFTTCNGMPCVAFCNGDGKLKGLPLNPFATLVWQLSIGAQNPLMDHLVGNIAVITGPLEWINEDEDDEEEPTL